VNLKLIAAAAVLAVAPAALFAAEGDGTTAVLNDVNASAPTLKLFDYIKTRPLSVTKNNLVLGQHLGGLNELQLGKLDINLHGVAGFDAQVRYPGIIGTRYDSQNKQVQDPYYDLSDHFVGLINERLIETWKAMHPIVAITATPPNPWKRNAGRAPSDLDRDLAMLLSTSTPVDQRDIDAKAQFWQDAAIIARGLRRLQDEGIPVVFRPLAEVNTDKYYSPTGVGNEQKFIGLWKDLYRYYVVEQGLHNLVFTWESWVWGRNSNNSDVARYWPGPETVDIVAGAYYFDHAKTYFSGNTLVFPGPFDQATHNNLRALALANNKPFGTAQWGLDFNVSDTNADGLPDLPGECGVNPCADPDMDGLRYGDNAETLLFKAARPEMSMVMYWNDQYGVELQQSGARLVSNAVVATLDDLPKASAEVPGYGVVSMRSDRATDGHVVEGGNAIANDLTLKTGDDAANKQLRAVVSFTMGLPANATVTGATLRVKRSSILGSQDKLDKLGKLHIDMAATGSGFSQSPALEATDYTVGGSDQASVSVVDAPRVDGQWLQINVPAEKLAYVFRSGVTQFRLRFATASPNGNENQLRWFAGDAVDEVDRPLLVVTYSLP
jgi:hypothetical protein